MRRMLKIGILGLLVAGVLVVTMAGAVLAQDDTPPATPGFFGLHGRGHGFGPGQALCGPAGMEAAADALGMTADELSAELWGGRTLADLADEAGVDLVDVRAAVQAACQAAVQEAIEQAVEDGRLTREHADWLLEGIENGYLGGRGSFGCRAGFGHQGFGQAPQFNRRFGFGRGPMQRGFPRIPGTPLPDSST